MGSAFQSFGGTGTLRRLDQGVTVTVDPMKGLPLV
jgi:hypothetical protein